MSDGKPSKASFSLDAKNYVLLSVPSFWSEAGMNLSLFSLSFAYPLFLISCFRN